MTEICSICRDNLPVQSTLRRSLRIRAAARVEQQQQQEEEVGEANLNRIKVSCCRQSFHATCLLLWLQQNPTCPICRSPFIPNQEQPRVIAHNPPTTQHNNYSVHAFMLLFVTFFLWTLYFIAREWYSNGIVYIAQMFGTFIVMIAATFLLSGLIRINART